jgi:hypothetical protein
MDKCSPSSHGWVEGDRCAVHFWSRSERKGERSLLSDWNYDFRKPASGYQAYESGCGFLLRKTQDRIITKKLTGVKDRCFYNTNINARHWTSEVQFNLSQTSPFSFIITWCSRKTMCSREGPGLDLNCITGYPDWHLSRFSSVFLGECWSWYIFMSYSTTLPVSRLHGVGL